MKILRIAAYVMAILFPVLAYASDIVPTPDVIAQNASLFQYFLGAVLLFNLWLVSRWIKTSEKNNEKQWESIRGTNKVLVSVKEDVAVLKAEHKIYHKKK